MARYDEEELISRATRAYCTRQRRSGESYDQPSASSSHAEEHDGRVFIVLESIKGILAVYRLKDDGHIEYVQEEYWPARLLEEYKVVHPGLDGTYEGTCIACLTPTDTVLAAYLSAHRTKINGSALCAAWLSPSVTILLA